MHCFVPGKNREEKRSPMPKLLVGFVILQAVVVLVVVLMTKSLTASYDV